MLKIKTTKNNKTKKIKIIGLTGGIGSGKSTVSRLFQNLGISIIDADEISRKLTADNGKALKKIRKVFGDSIFLQTQPSLKLNRDALRNVVFNSKINKKILENILHPLIFTEIKRNIKKNIQNLVEKNQKFSYIILDVPLLYESPKLQKLCHQIISVECSKNLQIQRVQQRNNLDLQTIEKIINSQATPKQRIEISDHIIQNDSNLDNLKIQVEYLHKALNF